MDFAVCFYVFCNNLITVAQREIDLYFKDVSWLPKILTDQKCSYR